MDVDAVTTAVCRIMDHVPVGTVITVMADGSVVTDGPGDKRPGWQRRRRPLTAFVVSSRKPSHLAVYRRIYQGLLKLES